MSSNNPYNPGEPCYLAWETGYLTALDDVMGDYGRKYVWRRARGEGH